MKFIARHLNLIGLLLLASFTAAAAGLYFGLPEKAHAAPAKPDATQFTCPMHPQVVRNSAGDCPECGMRLVAIGGEKNEVTTQAHKDGCCAEKPVAAEPSPAAMACPHLAAQAVQAAQTASADACCPKPVNP